MAGSFSAKLVSALPDDWYKFAFIQSTSVLLLQLSDLAAALNDFFASSYADGSMEKCAETYGVQAAIAKQ